MGIFFTADTHFGHGGALGLFRRPFGSVALMDEALIERWNAVVGERDTVWHLGDFAVRPKDGRVAAILGRLAGEKHLLRGNTDGEGTVAAPGWASVRDYHELVERGVTLVLCHYPLRSWNRQAKGAWNLHGHSHGRLAPLTRQIDVGVDAQDFRPVTLDLILAGRRRRRASPTREP